MSDILSAVKKRGEGTPLLHTPINVRGEGSPRGGGGPQSSFDGSPRNNSNKSEEKMGEREWFRHVGKYALLLLLLIFNVTTSLHFFLQDGTEEYTKYLQCTQSSFELCLTLLTHAKITSMSHSKLFTIFI